MGKRDKKMKFKKMKQAQNRTADINDGKFYNLLNLYGSLSTLPSITLRIYT